MDSLTILLLLIILACLGILLWVFLRPRKLDFTATQFAQTSQEAHDKQLEIQSLIAEKASLETSYRLSQESILQLKEDLRLQNEKNEKLQNEKFQLLSEKAGLDATNKALIENQQKVKEEVESLQKAAQLQFSEVANKILEEKSQKFTDVNKQNIEAILRPLGENLKEFRENIQKNLTEETKQRTSLEEQIKKVMEQTTLVSEQANNLASALKSNNKKAGNWGEHILETILQNSGLIKEEHFLTQDSYIDENDQRKIPDIVVKLPDGRVVIVDSKVSLVAFDAYFSSENETDQAQYLTQHLESLRRHIKELSEKKYTEYNKSALDFTMLFVPIESAYLLAMQNDRELWDFAYQKRIILTSATTLISSLKIIADLWRKDKQNRNAQLIIEQGQKMLDKLATFLDSFLKIGKNIEGIQDSYSLAFKQLKEGRGNLIGQAQNLKELGLKSQKDLPIVFSDYEGDED